MKYLLTQLLGVLTLLFAITGLNGQDLPVISIADQQADPGQVIDVDVTATDFAEIVSTMFKLNWDEEVLRYVSLENIALGVSEDNGFNVMTAPDGQISYLFFDTSLEGLGVDDGTPLFTLRMEVIGENGDQTQFGFDMTEVADTSATALDATFSGGTITIGEPNSTLEVGNLALAAEVSPNPFSANANVILNLNEGGDVTWTLTEINGQTIARGERKFAAGTHTLEIRQTLFDHSGTYLLKLQTGDHVITRRLLYVKP